MEQLKDVLAELQKIKIDLRDLRDAVRGNENSGAVGLLRIIDKHDKRLDALEDKIRRVEYGYQGIKFVLAIAGTSIAGLVGWIVTLLRAVP